MGLIRAGSGAFCSGWWVDSGEGLHHRRETSGLPKTMSTLVRMVIGFVSQGGVVKQNASSTGVVF